MLKRLMHKGDDATLRELTCDDEFYLIASGSRYQLWTIRHGYAVPVSQRQGGCFVVSIEVGDAKIKNLC